MVIRHDQVETTTPSYKRFRTVMGENVQVIRDQARKPVELLFLVPTPPAGEYTLEARTTICDSADSHTNAPVAMLIVLQIKSPEV